MKKRGVGCACAIYPMDPSNASSSTAVFVRIFHDGSASVWNGSSDLGQGSATALVQIASETLGIPMEKIRYFNSDTAITPYDEGTGASRSTYICGTAIKKACEDAKQQLLSAAAIKLQVPDPGKFTIRDERVYLKNFPEVSMSIGEAAWESERVQGKPIVSTATFGTLSNPINPENGHGRIFEKHIYATHIAEVEVDTETGAIELLRYVAVHDAGTVVNPMMLKGQIEGGVAFGLGQALMEELIEDPETGALKNPTFSDYLIPTAKDMPKQLIADYVEFPDPDAPYGALGIGEATSCPVCPAVANAIYDAVGVRIFDLPMTPQKILAAIRKKESAGI